MRRKSPVAHNCGVGRRGFGEQPPPPSPRRQRGAPAVRGVERPFPHWARSARELPAPVRRYLARAIGRRGIAVRTVRLRHGGLFRTTLDGSWVPIRGEQYFSAAPPGFVWRGRIRIAPGLWVDARDRSVDGAGSMRISFESTFTLADSSGAELDQGALLRLLGGMTWFPPVSPTIA